MTARRDFYVYVIFRPDGRPCYVGKGHGNRIERHRFRCTNKHLAHIMRAAGGDLPKRKVRENLTEDEAFSFERELIADIGREINGGPLVNQTDGGEGPTGFKMPPEVIAKLSKINTGNKYSVGRKATPETRAKQRAKKLGRKATEATKAKMRAAHALAPPRDPAWGAKISAAKMGHEVKPETVEKLRSWKRSPELCARIAAATKEAMNRPDIQAKLHAPRMRIAP